MAEGDERQTQGRAVVSNEGIFMLCVVAVSVYAVILVAQVLLGEDDD